MIGGLALTKLLVHLLVLGRYGIHGDEMYFLACGRELAAGYVDHPPLVPWIARLVELTLGDSVAALRVVPALAGSALVVITMLLCRELGGGRWAQATAGLCVIVAPVYLRAQSLLSLPAFEPLLWTSASLCVMLALRSRSEGDADVASRHARWWLAAGLIAGVGLLNKHTMVVWGLGVALGLVLSRNRRALGAPWPWLGGLLALSLFLPNLLWQLRHDWPTLEFLANMRGGILEDIPRLLFVLGQVLYQHPLALPIWIAGLIWTLGSRDLRAHPIGWIYLVGFAIFFMSQGKPYYLAPAYPPLYAAGAISFQFLLRGASRVLLPILLTAGGAATALVALPVLPLERIDAILAPIVAPVLERPSDLTSEFHEQMGYRELGQAVDDYVAELTTDERENLVLIARSYPLAGALERFSEIGHTRPVLSGHLTWWLWGPRDANDELVVVVGYEPALIASWCPAPERVLRTTPRVAGREHPTVATCRGGGRPLSEIWSQLRQYGHGPASPAPQATDSR